MSENHPRKKDKQKHSEIQSDTEAKNPPGVYIPPEKEMTPPQFG